ncbi:MAG: putative toxin-antitoxin system toxin component, PIN family [Acidovorax sp.]|uniref:putative toxin-antitoxin system toxin component, PIN family n=1 Tax=Acidovorax sp. TaxID=1872122 RepID=UPI0039E245FF
MNYVLDTNVLVAAVRSPAGASAELLRRALLRQVPVLCSVPLFMEYEAVLMRPEQLAAAGAQPEDVRNTLHVLARVLVPVSIQFLWRPQLRDPNDDMVLELAVNGLGQGQPVTLVTFNQRDFLPQAARFGIPVIGPAQYFQGA